MMIHRTTLTLAAAVLLALPAAPAELEAQQPASRMRVLVANLQPTDGTRTRFGEQVANELRNIIDLDTHVAMSSRDIDQAARQFDLRLNNLDCITARQLAAQIQAGLVFCGRYRTEDGLIHYDAAFYTAPGGEEFPVPSAAVREGDTRDTARQILDFFNETAERVNQIQYCLMDFSSSNWEGAIRYCQRAVELAPETREARQALARTYMELGQYEQSLREYEILLDRDPFSSSALETAGWVAAQLGQREKAREFYGRYLDLNPGNVQIRMQIAFDISQAGDDFGAMQLLRGGFEHDPDNIDLHERYGAAAFRAAVQMQGMQPQQAQQDGDRPALDPQVAELYREAVGSLTRVMEDRQGETPPTYVVNMMRAYQQLGEPQSAIALGERVVTFLRDNPQVLSELAMNYGRAGQVDQASEMMRRALQLQQDIPDARFRMANLFLEQGRVDEAVEWVRMASEAGERDPDTLGNLLFGHGWREGVQQGDRALGIRLFLVAKDLPGISDGFRSQVNFFHGYTMFDEANVVLRQDANISLQLAQRYRPHLQEALVHLRGGEAYARQANQNLQQIIDATNTWIDVVDAVIARETRN